MDSNCDKMHTSCVFGWFVDMVGCMVIFIRRTSPAYIIIHFSSIIMSRRQGIKNLEIGTGIMICEHLDNDNYT